MVMRKNYHKKSKNHQSNSVERRKGNRRIPTRRNRSRSHHQYPRPTELTKNLFIEIPNGEEGLEKVNDNSVSETEKKTVSNWKLFIQNTVPRWILSKHNVFFAVLGVCSLLFLGIFLTNGKGEVKTSEEGVATSTSSSTVDAETENKAEIIEVKPVFKSQEAKELVMQEDFEYMSSLGLYYDYANLSLEETVKAYLNEQGLDPSQVAFTYKNLGTNEIFSMNDSQLMTAGSTYKLPLNMLVVDAIEKGEVSATESYDITNLTYEYKPEHDAYVENYNGQMTIADMQYGSIVVSENTPAYALADRLGGMDKAYSMFDRYGTSLNSEVPTFSSEDNKTTTSYYTKVLDYLYKHQDKYADLFYYLDIAFPGLWMEEYVHGVTIYQKPGYVREALNIDAIVMEETPYSIALYTSYFGNASEDDIEIDSIGYVQVTSLAYVINEWHRVNMNPTKE